MPPRRRAAVPAGLAAGLTIGGIPDAVLVAIMERLTLEERHRAAAPVCRRWRLSVNDPSLLRELDFDIDAPPARLLPRLRSLGEWLQVRAAPHVQQLSLKLSCQAPLVGDDLDEAKSIVPAMLAACGAAGQLVKLELDQNLIRLHLGSWTASMGSSLQKLTISDIDQELILGNLQPLTALRELGIWSLDVAVRPGAHLPASITKLEVFCSAMVPQLSALTRLDELSCSVMSGCASDAYTPLARLPSLRRLDFSGSHSLPACLSLLTSLVHLCVIDSGAGTAGLLKAALPQLTALTYLNLEGVPNYNGTPLEVAGLARLRRFAWSGQPAQGAALPNGPWLSALRRLVAPASVLAGSLQQLSAAQQLEQLGVGACAGASANRDLSTIVNWALHRPSLLRLVLPALSAEAGNAALAVQRCRPGLRIELHDDDVAKLNSVVDKL